MKNRKVEKKLLSPNYNNMGNFCSCLDEAPSQRDSRSENNAQQINTDQYIRDRTARLQQVQNNFQEIRDRNQVPRTTAEIHNKPIASKQVNKDDRSDKTVLCANPQLIVFHKNVIAKTFAGFVFKGLLDNKNVAFTKVHSHRDVTKELEILRGLEHKHVIRHFLSYKAEDSNVYIVTEYFNNPLSACVGTLQKELKDILMQMTDALMYLQNLNIVHLALNPKSIFIVNKGNKKNVKIVDFSCAVQIQGASSSVKNLPEDRSFVAPEVNNYRKAFMSSDAYSLGAIVFYIFTRGKNLQDLKTISMPIIVANDALCADLIMKLTTPQPGNRLDVELIMPHPFFWDSQQIVNFIVDICKLVENGGAHFKRHLFKKPKLVFGGHTDWTIVVEDEILEEIEASRQEYNARNKVKKDGNGRRNNNILTLVQAIRNIAVHAQTSEVLLDKMGTNEKLVRYWFDKFPYLLSYLENAKKNFESGIIE